MSVRNSIIWLLIGCISLLSTGLTVYACKCFTKDSFHASITNHKDLCKPKVSCCKNKPSSHCSQNQSIIEIIQIGESIKKQCCHHFETTLRVQEGILTSFVFKLKELVSIYTPLFKELFIKHKFTISHWYKNFFLKHCSIPPILLTGKDILTEIQVFLN